MADQGTPQRPQEVQEQELSAGASQQQQAPASASGTSPVPVQSMTPEQYTQALQATQPITFAGAAATVASLPSLGALPNPDLTDCILCDHGHTLTLFNHFFQAAQAGAVNIQDMVLGALAIDLRLHSQAEMQVLYPVLSQRLGAEGMAWAQRSLQEHMGVEQAVADCLALRQTGGEPLVMRVKLMQQEFLAHLQEEETVILPAVAAALTPAELASLALNFKQVKQTAPLLPQTPEVQAAMAAAEGATTIKAESQAAATEATQQAEA